MWEGGLGDQGRGHNKQGNPLRMNLIPGATPRKRNERRTLLSFAKLTYKSCSCKEKVPTNIKFAVIRKCSVRVLSFQFAFYSYISNSILFTFSLKRVPVLFSYQQFLFSHVLNQANSMIFFSRSCSTYISTIHLSILLSIHHSRSRSSLISTIHLCLCYTNESNGKSFLVAT